MSGWKIIVRIAAHVPTKAIQRGMLRCFRERLLASVAVGVDVVGGASIGVMALLLMGSMVGKYLGWLLRL